MSKSYNEKVAEWASLLEASLPSARPDDPDLDTADSAR
ncbi:hypothetical protein C439_10395 [Haloferax mediterranei ATCC 33500]|uniref:Uncharacterized protein n=1 Tax=Haloferax mediterranei (strain ATCC 33500 / DSM 1411 / JCM 8866 / NBRC 14739 / NCIMB 2177 / R-4) TaxID=523841 RepID=M0J221_HALMT|nr:hypothetical protein C439_10395 [Haloferax mediterranei ATCC 33500]